MKERSLQPEIMDRPDPPPELARMFHRDLNLIHRAMGNWRAIARRVRGARSVIDIGCGDGALLAYLRATLSLEEITGVDLKPPSCAIAGIPILAADATRDLLPRADTAVSVMLLHHLTDDQVIALIRNARRSVKRFISLDPVRHPLPLIAYTLFFCPFLSKVGASDGRQSIRRSFLPSELAALAARAIAGTGATFEHRVSPFYSSQVIDIRWPHVTG
jgi:SAM-dependent methyltransferase